MCYEVEPADVWTEKFIKTRKEHKCYECRKLIPRGTTNIKHWKMLFNGSWDSGYECSDCTALRVRIIHHELAEGCVHSEADPGMGGLIEAARELRLI